jgi:hypothetical protein
LEINPATLPSMMLFAAGLALVTATAIFAFFAAFERKRIIERTIAGMERARRESKPIGRLRLVVDRDRARRLRAKAGQCIVWQPS